MHLIAFLLLWLLPVAALAAAGQVSACNGTATTTASNVVFPSSGTGPPSPQGYVWLTNISSAQLCWSLTGTATISGTLCTGNSTGMAPGAGFIWNASDPIPPRISIIASATGSTYACNYN